MAASRVLRTCSGAISDRTPSAYCSAMPARLGATGCEWQRRPAPPWPGSPAFTAISSAETPCRTRGLWPYPQIDAVATAGIVVDGGGSRLLDEGLGGISITNDLARLDDPLCATVICDAAIWDTAGRAAQIPPNPQLVEGGGTLHEAGTVEELAGLAGLDPATLRATAEVYNAAVRNGRLAELAPPRS